VNRWKKSIAVTFAVALCTCAIGCYSVRRGEPLTGPVRMPNQKVAHGQQLYMRYCYSCHQAGDGGMAPAINNKPAPRWLIKTQVRTGLGAMPAFNKNVIAPDDLDDLVDYIIHLRHEPVRR
jgi:mono/diheme cytochrome c family protein